MITVKDLSTFAIIQLAMICYACAEAYMEGAEGWKWNPSWWRIHLYKNYYYNAYHFFVYYGVFPLLIILLPLLLVGFTLHFFLVLCISFIVGLRVEDFTWFVVNPLHPLSKWNPKDTRWYPWVKLGTFSLPLSYVISFFVTIILLLLLWQLG